jgi:hypothetical protein
LLLLEAHDRLAELGEVLGGECLLLPKAGVKRRCWKPTPCVARNSSEAISSIGRVEAMA